MQNPVEKSVLHVQTVCLQTMGARSCTPRRNLHAASNCIVGVGIISSTISIMVNLGKSVTRETGPFGLSGCSLNLKRDAVSFIDTSFSPLRVRIHIFSLVVPYSSALASDHSV